MAILGMGTSEGHVWMCTGLDRRSGQYRRIVGSRKRSERGHTGDRSEGR